MKKIRLPLHPSQIISIRHPVTHQTTEKNIEVKKFSPYHTDSFQSKSHKTFLKSFLRETDFLRLRWETRMFPGKPSPLPSRGASSHGSPFLPGYKPLVPSKCGNIQHSSYFLCNITPRFQLIVFISFKLFPLSFFKEVHLQNSETTGFDLKKRKKKYQNIRIVDFFSLYLIYCVGISSPLWRSS